LNKYLSRKKNEELGIKVEKKKDNIFKICKIKKKSELTEKNYYTTKNIFSDIQFKCKDIADKSSSTNSETSLNNNTINVEKNDLSQKK
jgi:hypothetical protein